jgi:excisionase family DNA binding protein
MSEQSKIWLSVDGISQYLGVSKETIYRWVAKKRIPAYRVGKLWKFSLEEIDMWVRAEKHAEIGRVGVSDID